MPIPDIKFSVIADTKPAEIALKSIRESSLRTFKEINKHWEDILRTQKRVSDQQIRLAKDTANQINNQYKMINPGQSNVGGSGRAMSGGMSGFGGAMGIMSLMNKLSQSSHNITGVANPIQIIEDPKNLINSHIRDLISVMFDSIKSVVEEVASSFASAAMELGGAKNLSQILVAREHTENQGTINWAMSTTAGRGGLSPAENVAKLRGMSDGTIFDPDEIAKAQAEWVHATGSLEGFNEQFSMLNEMAVVSGQSLSSVTKSMTVLRNQFQGLNDDEFKKLELAAFGLSKLGEVPFEQITKLSKATASEALMKGDPIQNFTLLSAVAQKTAAAMGGGGRVATAEGRFFNRIATKGGFGFAAGDIADPRKVLEEAVIQSKNDRSKLKGLGIPESQFLEILGTHATGNTPEEQKKSLDSWIASIEKSIETQDQLNQEYHTVMDTIENKLKAAFVEIKNQVSTSFGPAFEALVTDFKMLSNVLSIDGDAIKNSMDVIITAFEQVIPWIFWMGEVIALVGEDMLKFVRQILKSAPGGEAIFGDQIKLLSGMIASADETRLALGEGKNKSVNLTEARHAKEQEEYRKTIQAKLDREREIHDAGSTKHPFDWQDGNEVKRSTVNGSNDLVKWTRELHQSNVDHKRISDEQIRIMRQMVPNNPNRSGQPNK